MPVVIRSLSLGSASITAFGKRRALAHGDHDLEILQRRDHLVAAAEMGTEHLDVDVALDWRPVSELEAMF